MTDERDLYYKGLRIGGLVFKTSASAHSILTTDELALAMSLGSQALREALSKILDAKGEPK